MIWTSNDIDLVGTLRDLDLAPLPARVLVQAAIRITDTGTRALLVSTLLAHRPHRIRSDSEREESGYQFSGGRALRCAVTVRALELMEAPVDPSTTERLLAATMLGHLVHTGASPDVSLRRAQLHDVVDSEWDHLASWRLTRARAANLLSLAVTAAGLHPGATGPWIPTALPVRRLVMACKAAERARPLEPWVVSDPAPLPAWIDPTLPVRVAARLYLADTAMERTLTLRRLTGPGRRFQSRAESRYPHPETAGLARPSRAQPRRKHG
jgi:hypothetical protein